MIIAHHTNDITEYKQMAAFHLLFARGIRTYLFPIFLLLIAVLLFVFAIIVESGPLYVGAGVLFAFSVAMPFIALWIQNAKIDKNIRANPNYLHTEQFYEFSETGFTLRIRSRGNEETYEFPWEKIVRIYERANFFYIYLSRTQALILTKNGIEGSVDELALLFRAKGKQFREAKRLRGNG